jgi:hypothetical protein
LFSSNKVIEATPGIRHFYPSNWYIKQPRNYYFFRFGQSFYLIINYSWVGEIYRICQIFTIIFMDFVLSLFVRDQININMPHELYYAISASSILLNFFFEKFNVKFRQLVKNLTLIVREVNCNEAPV